MEGRDRRMDKNKRRQKGKIEKKNGGREEKRKKEKRKRCRRNDAWREEHADWRRKEDRERKEK